MRSVDDQTGIFSTRCKIQIALGPHKVSVKRVGFCFGIGLQQVYAHFVVDGCLGLTGAIIGGHGLTDHRFADLFVPPLGQAFTFYLRCGYSFATFLLVLMARNTVCRWPVVEGTSSATPFTQLSINI